MNVFKHLLNDLEENQFNRIYNRAVEDDSIASRSYYISACFLFTLCLTNSAAIYYSAMLEHTQNSLALEIVQQVIISPPPRTIYLKNREFQYTYFLEDLEEVRAYLKHQKINCSIINVVERGGSGSWFPVPKLLEPIDKLIPKKKKYQIITKVISAGALLTLAGFTMKGVQEVKVVHDKILTPVLKNPKKAETLRQCLTLYLEANGINNIGELLLKPQLWGDLYTQLLVVSGDLVGLAKKMDYYKLFSYLTYFSGLNVNVVIFLGFCSLNFVLVGALGFIAYLPIGAGALPALVSTCLALTLYYLKTVDWAFLGALINSLPDFKGITAYLNLLIKSYIEQARLGIDLVNNKVIDVDATECPDLMLPSSSQPNPGLPSYHEPPPGLYSQPDPGLYSQPDPGLYNQPDSALPSYHEPNPGLLPYPETKNLE